MYLFKGKDARDYYYIEIVKCYLCLALNHHQNGVSTWPCGSFEGLWCLQMWKRIKWFAVQVVRLVPEGVHIHLLSPLVWLWKWRSKYLKGEINVERAHPRQFKVRIQSAKMMSAASAAEPAAVAPPAGQWQKRGKNSARQACANVWARRKRMVGSFFMNIGFE